VRKHRTLVEMCRRLNASSGVRHVARGRGRCFRSGVDEQVGRVGAGLQRRRGQRRAAGTGVAAIDRLAVAGQSRRQFVRPGSLPYQVGSVDEVLRRRPRRRTVAVAGTFSAGTGSSGSCHVTSGSDVLDVVAVGRVLTPGISGDRSSLPDNHSCNILGGPKK